MRKTYLQEHHKLLYSRMLMDGSLWQHLHPLGYIISLIAGSVAGALMLAVLKKNQNKAAKKAA